MKTKLVSSVSTRADRRGRGEAEAVRGRVVAAARRLFLDRGFLGTTSDDIAAELGMSKATLYRTFRSKEEILRSVVRDFMDEVSGRVDALMREEGLGLADKMAKLFALIVGRISQFGPVFLRDLPRGAPTVWKEVERFRREKINANFQVLLDAGRGQGLFRGDIDEGFLMRIFVRLIEDFVNPAEILRSGRTPAETFGTVITVFFQGILTDKGRRDFYARTPALFPPRKEGAS